MQFRKQTLLLAISLCFTVFSGNGAFGVNKIDQKAEDVALGKAGKRIDQDYELPASKAVEKGAFDRAIELYKGASAQWLAQHWQSPTAREARNMGLVNDLSCIAHLYRKQGRFDAAAKIYMQCEVITGIKSQFRSHIADTYTEGKMFAKAEAIYRTDMKEGKPEDAFTATIALAKLYDLQGQLADAEKTLQDLLDNSVKIHNYNQVRSARVALRQLWQKENKTADLEKIDAALNDKHCPVCGLDDRVLAVAEKYYVRGGCFKPSYPHWCCERDDTRF
jgi:tetratricopeptide (TPR) repeat protein